MKKSNIVLLIVFLVLGLAVYLIQQPSRKAETEKPADLGIMFPDFKAGDITQMEFGSFGGSIILKKDSDKWVVLDGEKNYPANEEAVQKVLETVQTMEARELISTNPGKHITFQVNSPQETESTDESGNKKPFKMGTLGTEVKLTDQNGNDKAHFFVGKNGAADFMSTYVRKNGSDNVVLVDGYLKATFGKGSAANWKDLVISKLEKGSIREIFLGAGKDQIVLQAQLPPQSEPAETTPAPASLPEDIPWVMTKPENMTIDPRHINRLLGQFTNFSASDYAPELPDAAEYGFEKPSAVAKTVLIDGSEIEFVFGNECKEKSGQFYIRKTGDDRIFLVPKYRLDTVAKKVSDFKEPADKPMPGNAPKLPAFPGP